jgi:translation initiation factor 2B subunit (eIF-2B alpha/beta/delta family)
VLLLLLLARPLSVSMGNAIKALKLYLSKIDPAGEARCYNHNVIT